MTLQLKQATDDQRSIVVHLMQFYLYDFTDFLSIDITVEGNFPEYPDLHQYWTSGDQKMPFLFWKGHIPIGFALVDCLMNSREGDYYMAEFFVLRPYRHSGVGTWAAYELFQRYPGRWKVTQMSNNRPAQSFWRKVIGDYTDGAFREKLHPLRRNPSQYFDTQWIHRVNT